MFLTANAEELANELVKEVGKEAALKRAEY